MAQRGIKGKVGLMKAKRLMAFANPDHQGAVAGTDPAAPRLLRWRDNPATF
jgi:hypothetical protein